jgi:hypothetical protein
MNACIVDGRDTCVCMTDTMDYMRMYRVGTYMNACMHAWEGHTSMHIK